MTQEDRLISTTQSVCPECLAIMDADRIQREDGIYLEKECALHGKFSTLIWEGDALSYEAWNTSNQERDEIPKAVNAEKGCPYDCGLCEAHQRSTCCVLLELTNRCNLRCPICFANADDRGEEPSLVEIERLYSRLNESGGGYNIQLSGGEPTLRDDLPEIIELGIRQGFSFFQLNTNGIRLAAEKDYAKTLKAAGLNCVFLQFDSANPKHYEKIRGRDLLSEKFAAINTCAQAGLGVVLVPTLVAGVNTEEIGAILDVAELFMPAVRGVHFQPVSYFGRYEGYPPAWRITIPYLLKEIEKQTQGRMQAADFVGGGAENAYCSFHANYVRDASGNLHTKGRTPDAGCCSVSSRQSREVVATQWSRMNEEEISDGFSAWLAERHEKTLAISGMLFQDAWTLDLDRLKKCYITEVDRSGRMIPFCAYNLTAKDGRALYRGAK